MADARFTEEVYERIRDGCQRSAAVMVPLVLGMVPAESVVDVGCGEGWFGRELARAGCKVVGLDDTVAHWSFEQHDVEHGDGRVDFLPTDLTDEKWAESASLERRAIADIHGGPVDFDLAVCLEVAEHLPEESAGSLVGGLCALAPVILFSAAIPRQGGHGHLNERWPGYWADLFAAHGYRPVDCLRREIWVDDRVEPWYCVPDDAEILTDRGWLLCNDLDRDDQCLQYDVDQGDFLWAGIHAVNVFDYDGDLVEVAGRWRSTPDHRWPVLSQLDVKRCSGTRWKTAQDVVASDRLVQIAGTQRVFPQTSLLPPRDAAILGWIVTDGTMQFRSNGRPRASIYQSPKKHLDKIIDLLGAEAAGQWSDNRPRSHGCVTVGVRVSALDRLVAAGFRSKDDLPGIVLRLDRDACEAMWNAMMLAEGSRNTGSLVFNQNRGPVADAFQLLSFLLGYRVNLTGARHCIGGTGKGRKSGRTVGISTKTLHHYRGKVWCPTTVSGTWVMRQNGAIVVTGNSQNSLLFAVEGHDLLSHPDVCPADLGRPLSLVHPDIYQWRLDELKAERAR